VKVHRAVCLLRGPLRDHRNKKATKRDLDDAKFNKKVVYDSLSDNRKDQQHVTTIQNVLPSSTALNTVNPLWPRPQGERLLGGEVGGPASRSRVSMSVVDVVVFALFVRSLSFCPLAFFVDGVCSFLFVLSFLCRSVGFGQWGSFII
jgi:hypothetical protein